MRESRALETKVVALTNTTTEPVFHAPVDLLR
jgi:hypothetical protein